ncbi:MAG: FHA domain-containing protein [Myxococcota bacterium]
MRVVEGPLTGARFRLGAFSVVGRHPTCDVVLFGRGVSREHAALRCRDGVVEVNDLASVNGVFVNGERLLKRRRIRMGDRIQISEHVLLFVLEHPDQTDPLARRTAHLPRIGLTDVVGPEDCTQRIPIDVSLQPQAS